MFGIRIVTEAGIDRFDSSGFTEVSNQSITGYQPTNFSAGNWNLGGYTHFTDARQNKKLKAYFNYSKEIGKVKVDATAGYNYQLFQREGYKSGQTREPNPLEDVETNPDINFQMLHLLVNLRSDGDTI